MTGRIIKIISNLYTVTDGTKSYECRARGLFRKDEITPLVGDNVEFSESDLYITKILERKNELSRPKVANIDKCIIVSSVKNPDFSSYLLDKMLVNIISNNIKPIIVFSKYDLLDTTLEIDNLVNYYNSIGIPTFINNNIQGIKASLSNSIVALTGQTGAGKSTLINKMDSSLNLKTDDISYALNRGKHTTRHVEIYKIDDFYIMDTPGFSALDINTEKLQIRFSYPEFNNHECKFNDCKHLSETGCKVKEDVESSKILLSRYENYRKMMEE
jgi:ribosome biogenesis GTPase